jgi:hypothetical protein
MAAIANVNHEINEIQIISTLYLYGSQASNEIGAQIIEEINRLYNEPEVFLRIKGQRMNVAFLVGYELRSIEDAIALAKTNRDFKNNFIRIESKNSLTRSFMGFGLGDNAGHWLTSDQLGVSTTAAHEFGHGLGLDHPLSNDYRGSSSPPPIMAPRGSLVESHYQWNPAAKPGEFGGTMNPKYRKVTVQEIEMIVKNISRDFNGNPVIGRISNTLFTEDGDSATQNFG